MSLEVAAVSRVIMYMNDQPGAKADDVRMSGAGTHTEQNASDQPGTESRLNSSRTRHLRSLRAWRQR